MIFASVCACVCGGGNYGVRMLYISARQINSERLISALTVGLWLVIDTVRWQNKQSVTNPDYCLWAR